MATRRPKEFADCPVNALRGSCFCQAAPDRIADLRLEERTFPARAVLSQQGDAITQILLLREGWVIRYRLLPDGGRRIITFYLPGDSININALFHDRSDYSLQALTPVRLCVFGVEAFREWHMSDPQIATVTGNLIAAEMFGLQDRVINLSARSGLEAIASLFLELHARLKRRGMASDNAFDCPITQDHIADSVGLTKVHVSRTLSILRKEGLLEIQNQEVSFPDIIGLRQITGFVDIAEP